MIKKGLKFFSLALLSIIIGLLAYIWIAPPDILRVATNYSAKIVCSNVFIANRDADEVLSTDVQAPGHPLLTQVSVRTDESAGSAQAHIFGFFAPATSQYREGLGCTNVHDTQLDNISLPLMEPLGSGTWPAGNTVDAGPNAKIESILADAALLGAGHRAVVVVKNGQIIGEVYADGFDANTPLLGWSMTKTVTAALLGTLLRSDQTGLDDTFTDVFPTWADDNRRDITLRDMLAMESGLSWNEGYGSVSDVTRMLYLENDMAGFAASLPAEAVGDGVFNYSSGTTTALSRVWQDEVGDEALIYPRKVLFEPLGMTSAILETDASNTFVGSSYMYATAYDWARFGQFLLQDGVWNGERILPEGFPGWLTGANPDEELSPIRGHIWETPPGDLAPFEDALWLRGHDGQSIGIFPNHDMVLVRLGLTPSRLEYSPVPLANALIAALGN